MRLSVLDNVLWAAGFLGSVALLCVLVYRRRFKTIPAFTALIAFEVAETIVLFGAYKFGSPHLYAAIFWITGCFDFCLQIWVAIEIARIVLRPTGTWIQDAKKQFTLWSLVGIVVAALLTWMVSPPVAHALERLELQGDVFTSLVICELFAVITLTSNKLGLGWRSHVMALGQGMTAWSACAVAMDIVHSYFRGTPVFMAAEHVETFVYIGTAVYWIVQLWCEEPSRRPISSDLQALIDELHRRVQYDLGRVTTGAN